MYARRQSGGRNSGAWRAGCRTSLHCGRRCGERKRRDQHPQTSHAQRTTHEATGATGSHDGAAAADAGHRQSLPAAQRHPDQHHRRRHPHRLHRRRRHLHPPRMQEAWPLASPLCTPSGVRCEATKPAD
ncbi:unnamed protein product [Closterium sp. NIES-54]